MREAGERKRVCICYYGHVTTPKIRVYRPSREREVTYFFGLGFHNLDKIMSIHYHFFI